MTMSLSALTLVSNTVVIQCACYSDVHPQHIIFMARRAIPMIAFPRVRCMFILYIYICLCQGCIRS